MRESVPVTINGAGQEQIPELPGIAQLGMCLVCSVARFDIVNQKISIIVVATIGWSHWFRPVDILPTEQQFEAFQFEHEPYVIGWGILIAFYIDAVRIKKFSIIEFCIYLCSNRFFKITIPVVEMTYLTIRLVDGCPGEDVGIHELSAQREISLMGFEVGIAVFHLHAFARLAALGDDVHHRREGNISVERGSRAAQHLDVVNLLGADGIARITGVVEAVVQAVAVFHNQDELLS